ncbi:MAG: lactate racemase domain-containing protein [Planctomycetota bacterium]|jgi:nickel-dependent lactate racemase
MLDKKGKNKNVINIPYENSIIDLPIFSNAQITELIPLYIKPLNHQQILHSIKNPVDNEPLSEIAKGKSNVLIIMENATRPLDTSLIASLVLNELRQAGVTDENITFLFANGAHKDMEEFNYKDKLGPRFKNFRIFNHDCEGKLTNLGTTKLGSPILINPIVLEADLKIAIGTIEPHYGAGVSGGAKILFPGCAGLEWIFNNHSLIRGEFGEVDNQWRNDTEESAAKVDIDFLINATLNYKQEIIGLYCGDWINAHREGVNLSLKASITELPYKADFCIAGSSPFDLNFLQTLKSIDATKKVIKKNGTYILLTSCPQGMGNHRWLLDEKMLEERHKLNADYDSAMTEIIYSTHLSEHELYSYYPKQVTLINDISKLRQVITSLDKPGAKGVVLPYSPITTLRYP